MKNNFTKAFGLIGFLIAIAIVILAGKLFLSAVDKQATGGPSIIEQGRSAIDEAENAKALMERDNFQK